MLCITYFNSLRTACACAKLLHGWLHVAGKTFCVILVMTFIKPNIFCPHSSTCKHLHKSSLDFQYWLWICILPIQRLWALACMERAFLSCGSYVTIYASLSYSPLTGDCTRGISLTSTCSARSIRLQDFARRVKCPRFFGCRAERHWSALSSYCFDSNNLLRSGLFP